MLLRGVGRLQRRANRRTEGCVIEWQTFDYSPVVEQACWSRQTPVEQLIMLAIERAAFSRHGSSECTLNLYES
jgi:hypothetical protein